MVNNANPDHRVLTAKADSTALISKILGSAFALDPVINWVTQDKQVYAPMFYVETSSLYQHKGIMHINRSNKGAALWLPPGVTARAPVRWATIAMLWKLFRSGGMGSLNRATQLENIFEAQHIDEPHFYLFAIARQPTIKAKALALPC